MTLRLILLLAATLVVLLIAVRPRHARSARAAQKEIAAIDRRLGRLADQIAAKHRELAEHDQSDHLGITRLTKQLSDFEDAVAELEPPQPLDGDRLPSVPRSWPSKAKWWLGS